jgi:hypothetical protein
MKTIPNGGLTIKEHHTITIRIQVDGITILKRTTQWSMKQMFLAILI